MIVEVNDAINTKRKKILKTYFLKKHKKEQGRKMDFCLPLKWADGPVVQSSLYRWGKLQGTHAHLVGPKHKRQVLYREDITLLAQSKGL